MIPYVPKKQYAFFAYCPPIELLHFLHRLPMALPFSRTILPVPTRAKLSLAHSIFSPFFIT
jgi:hypothetical protein